MKRLALVALVVLATAFDFTDPTTSGSDWTVTNVGQIETFLHAIDDCAVGSAVSGAGMNTTPSNCTDFLTATEGNAAYQTLDTDLTDLADGSLTGSKVGTGISAANVTTGTLGVSIPISTGVSGLGANIATALAVARDTAGAPAILIAYGAKALATGAINSGQCATDTATATGVASTDAISWNPNADITGVTGYVPTSAGGLAIYVWPTTNTINIKVCNPTADPITPGAVVTLNWRVVR